MCQRDLIQSAIIVARVDIKNACAGILTDRGDDHEDTTGIRAAVADQVKRVAVEVGCQRAGQSLGVKRSDRFPDTGLTDCTHISVVGTKDIIRGGVDRVKLLCLLSGSRGERSAFLPVSAGSRQEVLFVEDIGGGDNMCLEKLCCTVVKVDIQRNGCAAASQRLRERIGDFAPISLDFRSTIGAGLRESFSTGLKRYGFDRSDIYNLKIFRFYHKRKTEVNNIGVLEVGCIQIKMQC